MSGSPNVQFIGLVGQVILSRSLPDGDQIQMALGPAQYTLPARSIAMPSAPLAGPLSMAAIW